MYKELYSRTPKFKLLGKNPLGNLKLFELFIIVNNGELRGNFHSLQLNPLVATSF